MVNGALFLSELVYMNYYILKKKVARKIITIGTYSLCSKINAFIGPSMQNNARCKINKLPVVFVMGG